MPTQADKRDVLTNLFDTQVDDLIGYANMIKERQPALAGKVDATIRRVIGEMETIFQPYSDLADGKITTDEFFAQIAAREAADIERREEEYGNEGPWEVVCVDCGEMFESDELPSMHPQHTDIGIDCQEDDDDAEA